MEADSIERARISVATAVLRRYDEHLPGTRRPRIAAYVPLRTEPGSTALLAGLIERGAEVITPVLLRDNDLDWEVWNGDGTRLGIDAIAGSALVLVPALAVDHEGVRLGRGGGSYDRALVRVPADVPTAALLFDGEVLEAVPHEPWDVPVSAAVTPSGWVDLRGK